MELWFTEKQTPNVGITCKITRTLHTETTPFQELAVIETLQFGRMLVLDGMVQTTVVDEFVYHEMIAHVALNTHPNPEKVMVIGGGDGGTIREIVKHPKVKKAVLVEIDERVIEVSKQYLPEIAVALMGNPKVEVRVEDGIKHVKEHKGEYDVIIIDSTEPVGPAVELFSEDFYKNVYESLKDDGIMVAQTESPFFNRDIIKNSFTRIGKNFPITRLYFATVPTYPSGVWTFTLGSKKYDPLAVKKEDIFVDPSNKYYNAEVHFGAFMLPNFIAEIIK
ncbi:polyamine aminopropyltransferase [Carboxydothermus hydrogenoformans]|uniref:Polyamine aminopropyltransferase n=1 Tax=Carboxydothermus hydrogenoformans (strain ATCC BAA-161 / DSM 6008 / Z-2901) TaxID=246194 RepID=Q3ABP0_CARHZ|nr:polyamine aminopropyltransferase [Carboxydothermus hydrogenoformans]ABB13960.1 spermidine synthase [Carboxydothermus hydrogenoformans Z-2901]